MPASARVRIKIARFSFAKAENVFVKFIGFCIAAHQNIAQRAKDVCAVLARVSGRICASSGQVFGAVRWKNHEILRSCAPFCGNLAQKTLQARSFFASMAMVPRASICLGVVQCAMCMLANASVLFLQNKPKINRKSVKNFSLFFA